MVNLKLTFKKFNPDEYKVPYKHSEGYYFEFDKSGIALFNDGELAVIGKYNQNGGGCECCGEYNFETDIVLFAEVDLATLENLDELKKIAEVYGRHNA